MFPIRESSRPGFLCQRMSPGVSPSLIYPSRDQARRTGSIPGGAARQDGTNKDRKYETAANPDSGWQLSARLPERDAADVTMPNFILQNESWIAVCRHERGPIQALPAQTLRECFGSDSGSGKVRMLDRDFPGRATSVSRRPPSCQRNVL